MKIFFWLITLSFFLTTAQAKEIIYINNAAHTEGDGSFLHPYNKAEDILRAIKQAGPGGTIYIFHGSDNYVLPEQLNLAPNQTLTGTDPVLAGNIQLNDGVTVSHIHLINKPNGEAFGMRGHDIGHVTIDNVQVGDMNLDSSHTFSHGIYFDSDMQNDPRTSHLIIQNSTIMAAGHDDEVIGITVSKNYHDVKLQNVKGLCESYGAHSNTLKVAAGIEFSADNSVIANSLGAAKLVNATTGTAIGLQLSGKNLLITESIGDANTYSIPNTPDDIETDGISLTQVEFVTLDHSQGTASINGNGSLNASNGIALRLAQHTSLNENTFYSSGKHANAVLVDEYSTIQLHGSGASRGLLSIGDTGTNQATLTNIGPMPVILRNGETFNFSSNKH